MKRFPHKAISRQKIIEVCLLSICALIFSSSLLSAQELTDYEKLRQLIARIVKTSGYEAGNHESVEEARMARGAFPCWMLGADHRFAAPPPMIGLEVPGYDFAEKFVYRGMLSSEDYATGTVKRIDQQTPNDAGHVKRYFFWAYDAPLDKESDSVLDQLKTEEDEAAYLRKHALGLISFKVFLRREPYSKEIHQFYPFSPLKERHEVFRTALPVKYIYKKPVNWDGISIGGVTRTATEDVLMVAEEICYDPQPHLKTVDMSDMPWFSEALGVTNKTFTYLPGDIPTALMHRLYFNYYHEKNLQQLDIAETKAELAIIALRILYPVVNIGLLSRDYSICKEGGHHYCFASVAADGITSGGALLRIAGGASKVARFLKSVNLSQQKVGNSLIYLGIGSNLTLAELYRRKGDYLDAATRLGMSAIDLSPVMFKHIKKVFDDGAPVPSIVGAKLGRTEEACDKVDDTVKSTTITQKTGLCALPDMQGKASTRPEFYEAIEEGNKEVPGLFEPIKKIKVRRLDARNPSEIGEEGGWFPNPNHKKGTAVEHVNFEDPQTGSFVSVTLEEDDFGFFFRNEFFIRNGKTNYPEDGEIKLLSRVYTAADVKNGPPPPVEYEIWLYEITGEGVETAKVNPLEDVFKFNMDVARGEKEGLVRAIPLGEGHAPVATKYRIKREFYFVEDKGTPGSYRLRLTKDSDILDEDIQRFESVVMSDTPNCSPQAVVTGIPENPVQHLLDTGNGIKKCGDYNTATIFPQLKKVYKEPFAKWGNPVKVSELHIEVSEAVGNLNTPIRIITFQDSGLPGTYAAEYIAGQEISKLRLSIDIHAYRTKFSQTASALKARLKNKYPIIELEIPGVAVAKQWYDLGDGYLLAVDEMPFQNVRLTDSGEYVWIDPYMIVSRDEYIAVRTSKLENSVTTQVDGEEIVTCPLTE